MNQGSQKESKRYQAVLIILVALAVLSSATKDLNRLQEFTANMQELVAGWSNSAPFTVSAAAASEAESICAEPLNQDPKAQEFRWHGQIAIGKSIEIKGLNGDISAEPASGNEVEVVANKTSRKSDTSSVTIKVKEHEGGVTICAIYPTTDPNVFTPCRPSAIHLQSDIPDHSSSVEVRDNDVHVNFKIRVPAGVDFIARTVNGDIGAESLAGNVFSKTVNGNIRISTTGYADAKTVNGEISARIGSANWTGAINFKTVNGEINLELPASIGANVNAKTLHGEISSDFPLTVMNKFSKREFTGTIGGGGRELNLKTLNGSINLRRVG